MQEKKRPLWAMVMCAVLAGCGGGGGGENESAREPSPAALQALASAAKPAAATAQGGPPAGPQRRAQAYSADLAEKLFALAESSYAELFPSKQATRSFQGWSYRYYPETGITLAVIDAGVYALGGTFGPEAMHLGPITNFVQAPATGKDRPLTASILAQCPDAPSSSSPEFYKCMVGHLNGVQKFNSNKSCRLDITEAGLFTLSSEGQSVTVGPAYGFVAFTKISAAGLVSFTVKAQEDAAFAKGIAVSTPAFAFSFNNGGTLSAEATPSGSSTASISCTLTVPK